MKNVVLILGTLLSGVIMLLIVMTVNGRMNRSMELKSNLSSIVEASMENMMQNPKYSIHNINEFVADFMENLSLTIDSESDVRVDILDCDTQKGLLSVRVTLLYTHPNGMPGTVSCERLVIFDKVISSEGGL